jgi:hypothetical protein
LALQKSQFDIRVLIERRLELDPRIINYINRAGRRLNRKHLHLLLGGKRAPVAVIAVSRELAGFIRRLPKATLPTMAEVSG